MPDPSAPDPSAPDPFPTSLVRFLATEGFGEIRASQTLNGGMISLTRRIVTDTRTFVVKQARQAPRDLYRAEALGLRRLAAAGTRTVGVVEVADDYLLLDDLGDGRRSDLDWEELGRSLARQHRHEGERFGFEEDNYLGLLPQRNEWTTDGHEFFARHRILRFLEEPRCASAFDARDRRRLERLAERLPDLIPAQPPSLLHGDLWRENIVAGPGRRGVLVDPAVHFGWAEAELAMVQQCGGVPDRFFDAYVEERPLADGWRERLTILAVREWLSAVAHLGADHRDGAGPAREVRALLDRVD